MKNFSQYIVEGLIKQEIKTLKKKYTDAEVTFRKESSGNIVHVNGETAYNQDDNSFGSSEKILNALERAYKASKKVTESINEDSKDLSKYKNVAKEYIEDNNNISLRNLMSDLVKNKKLSKIVENINSICEIERENPISEYTSKIYNILNIEGRKKFGKDNWDHNIYNP